MVLRRITFPLIAPSILGAMVIAFAISFDEVLITNFTSGTTQTLPLFVLSRLRRTIDPSVNAVATILLLVPWIAVGLTLLWQRRRASRDGRPTRRPRTSRGLHDARPERSRSKGVSKRFGPTVALAARSIWRSPPDRSSACSARAAAGRRRSSRSSPGSSRPTRGRCLADGDDITERQPERRPFNMVFQHYALFPHMTVADNVGFGLTTAPATRPSVRSRTREPASPRCSGSSGLDELRAAVPVRALGRTGAAGRGRACVDQPARASAAGRAAQRARSQRPVRAPRGTPSDPSGAGHHVRVRDPRPGRGAQHLPTGRAS